MEAAVWKNDEIAARLDESSAVEEVEAEEELEEMYGKAKKGKKAMKRKGSSCMEDDTEHEDGEGAEELEEAAHVCPLCVSQLDESIDEERILEHLNVVLGLVDRLSQLHEGDEDIESVIDETIAELLFADEEE
jgi:DNA repair exonuclease SbcCD ATPase subunit